VTRLAIGGDKNSLYRFKVLESAERQNLDVIARPKGEMKKPGQNGPGFSRGKS